MVKVVARRVVRGRPVTGPEDTEVAEAPGEGVRLVSRRTAWIEVALDRDVRRYMTHAKRTYSATVEEALRDYLARHAARRRSAGEPHPPRSTEEVPSSKETRTH